MLDSDRTRGFYAGQWRTVPRTRFTSTRYVNLHVLSCIDIRNQSRYGRVSSPENYPRLLSIASLTLGLLIKHDDSSITMETRTQAYICSLLIHEHLGYHR